MRKKLCIILLLTAACALRLAAMRLAAAPVSAPMSGVEKLPPKVFVFGSALEGEEPEGGSVRTFLICGTTDGANADVCMALTMDASTGSVGLVSIPRDTKVYASRALKKLNGALGAGGMAQLRREAGDMLGYLPRYTLLVDAGGLSALVDAVGGVEMDVPRDMRYDDPAQNLHIDLRAGPQTLDGDKALQLLRFRGYAEADLKRVEVQRQFLGALLDKLKRPASILLAGEYAEIFKNHVKTELTAPQLAWIAAKMLAAGVKLRTGTLPTYTLPAEENPMYYQFVSTGPALEMINDLLNPSDVPITRADVRHAR